MTSSYSNLKDGKLPSCSKTHKRSFHDKPQVLDLTALKEKTHLITLLYKSMSHPGEIKSSIYGNFVNAPAGVSSTVNVLPWSINVSDHGKKPRLQASLKFVLEGPSYKRVTQMYR